MFKRAVDIDPLDSWAWQCWGGMLNDARRYNSAISKFRGAIRANLFNVNAHRGRSWALEKLGKEGQATAILGQIIEFNPHFDVAYIDYARLLQKQHKTDVAKEKMRIATDKTRNSSKVYAAWGDIFLDENEPEEAEKMYMRAIDADQNAVDGFIGLGRLKRRQANNKSTADRAIEYYKRANDIDRYDQNTLNSWAMVLADRGQNDEAIKKLREVLDLNPHNANAYVNWGKILLRNGQLEAALSKFKRAIRIDRRESRAWQAWGNLLLTTHDYKAAIVKIRRAVKLNRWEPSYYNDLGRVYWRLGRLQEAEAMFVRAIQEDSKFDAAYLNLGSLLQEQDKSEAAKDIFCTAAGIVANPAKVYTKWGDIFRNRGKLDEAAEMYQQAIEIDQNFAGAYRGLGSLVRRQARGEHAKNQAIRHYEEANKLDPYDQDTLRWWARALSEVGQFEEAIGKLENVLRLNPYDSGAYVEWGRILWSQGKPDKALAKFRSATQINPTDSWAWQTWGDLLLEMNDDQGGVDKFRRAMRRKPRFSSWSLSWDIRSSIELWNQGEREAAVRILERANNDHYGDLRLQSLLRAYKRRRQLEAGGEKAEKKPSK